MDTFNDSEDYFDYEGVDDEYDIYEEEQPEDSLLEIIVRIVVFILIVGFIIGIFS